MDLDFNWINLLILFGALQGLIFGIILLFNRKHPGSTYLGILMLVLSYNGFETVGWSAGLGEYTIIFDLFTFVWIFGLGPSLYLYIHSLLKPEALISKKDILIAYTPVAFQLIVRAVIFIIYITALLNTNATELIVLATDLFSYYHLYSEPLSIFVFLFYLYLATQVFLKVKDKPIGAYNRKNQNELIKWIQLLLVFFITLGVLWPVVLILPYLFEIRLDHQYYLLELLLVLFIYWIAFIGNHKIRVLHYETLKRSIPKFTDTEAHTLLEQLKDLMEKDKYYLDPELNRDKVASEINVNPKTVSAVLNQHANQNFNDFVNGYRVEEVARRLKEDSSTHLTISGIALESGFNSQATFQRVFKNIKGMSPKEYQNSLDQSSE